MALATLLGQRISKSVVKYKDLSLRFKSRQHDFIIKKIRNIA